MENFSYIGFLVVIGIVFLVMRLSNNAEAKDENKPAESAAKILWIAVIAVLAFLGLTVLAGDWQ